MNRIEVLIAESELEHGGHCNPPDLSTERLLTLCVCLDPTPATRREARSLAAAFVTAKCSFEQPSDGSPFRIEAVRLLRSGPPATVSLVVALPDEHDPDIERQIGEILGYLRINSRLNLQIAVAVTLSPVQWAACAFDGFLMSGSMGSVGDALAMFNMLAAIMAPDYLCPFDAYDILGCVGSAANPSTLHSFTFFPESGKAIPDSANAGKSLRACAAMVFAPVTHAIKLSELGRLLDALRSLVRPDCHIIQVAGYGLVARPPSSGAIPVQVLTRPTLS